MTRVIRLLRLAASLRSLVATFCVSALTVACGGGGSGAAVPHPPAKGSLSLLAGSMGGAGNLDGPANTARFNLPASVVATPNGDIYVADRANHAIRRVDVAGNVSTFAGRIGEAGDADGVGTSARFREPHGLAIDAGFLYVADRGNRMVRRIRLADALVDTLAGHSDPASKAAADGSGGRLGSARFTSPTTLALSPTGQLFVADDAAIRLVVGTASVTTVAGRLNANDCGIGVPTVDVPADTTICRVGGLALRAGDTTLYFTDAARNVVRALFAPSGSFGAPAANRIRFVAGSASGAAGTVDGVGQEARFTDPQGLAATDEGELIVGQRAALRLVRLSSEGDRVYTLAGSKAGEQGNVDGSRDTARFGADLAVFPVKDALLIADSSNHLVRTVDRNTQQVATRAGQRRETGSADGAPLDARFIEPSGISLSADGTVTLVDRVAVAVRRIDASLREVTTLAAAPVTAPDMLPEGIVAEDAGKPPVIASVGDHSIRTVMGGALTLLAGSGVLEESGFADGPGPLARFDGPRAIVREPDGTLLVADSGNHRIRTVAPGGLTTTLAGGVAGHVDGPITLARFNQPIGLARSRSGDLYVLEAGNRAIRKIVRGVDGGAIVSTVFEGLLEPRAIAIDDADFLYIVDGGEHTVRRYHAGQPPGKAQGEVIVGAPGRCGFVPGDLPGVICRPQSISVEGRRLVVTMEQGVALVEPLP